MKFLGAGREPDAIVFTTTELLGGAAGRPGGGCAGPEADGGPGPATPPIAVEEGGSDPEATPAGDAGAGVPPLTAGLPASAPAAAVPGGQLGAGAPTAPAVPLLCADPTDAEHELREFSPDELTVGPLPEGTVLGADGVVVAGGADGVAGGDAGGADGAAGGDAGGVGGDAGGEVGEVGAVPASEAVPEGQSVDPATAAPAVESRAAA